MKLIQSNLRDGTLKLKPESTDDIYVLSNVIDAHDRVKSRTLRKIKIGDEDSRNQSAVKKQVTLTIDVEKVDFSKHSPVLRISGKIIEGPEDIPRGSFHTITVEENSQITIMKDKWLGFQLDKIRDACKAKYHGIILLIFDRDEGFFVLVEKYSHKILSEIKGDVNRKRYAEKKSGNFFEQLSSALKEYAERYKESRIVIASPVFWKEELFAIIDDSLKPRVTLSSCSSVDSTAIEEVLKRPELKSALKDARLNEEIEIMNRLLVEISKNNLGVYGLKETEYCANIGAVETLIVTDGLLSKSRDSGLYYKMQAIMKNVESMKGRVVIISSDNSSGKSLDSLGGIGALLRYKVQR